MFCREQVAQLGEARDEIERRGAKLICIGNGSPHFARSFREDHDVQMDLYVDPSLDTYRALQFERSVGATFKLKTVKSAVRTMSSGFRQGRVQGDAWQQGGVVIVTPASEVIFRHANLRPDEHASIKEILDALDANATPAAS